MCFAKPEKPPTSAKSYPKVPPARANAEAMTAVRPRGRLCGGRGARRRLLQLSAEYLTDTEARDIPVWRVFELLCQSWCIIRTNPPRTNPPGWTRRPVSRRFAYACSGCCSGVGNHTCDRAPSCRRGYVHCACCDVRPGPLIHWGRFALNPAPRQTLSLHKLDLHNPLSTTA